MQIWKTIAKLVTVQFVKEYMNVTIYTQKNCQPCFKLKEEYKQKQIPFTEIELGKDISVAEFRELYPNVRSVPFVITE